MVDLSLNSRIFTIIWEMIMIKIIMISIFIGEQQIKHECHSHTHTDSLPFAPPISFVHEQCAVIMLCFLTFRPG